MNQIIKHELINYDQKLESIDIRSKCNCYKDGRKFSKDFLNLEKLGSSKSNTLELVLNIGEKEVKNQRKILKKILSVL